MRSCDEYRELISCMIDGELAEDDMADVRAHIAGCEDCRFVFEAFSALSGGLGELDDPPLDLAEGVMSHLTAIKTTRHHRKRARIITFASAAAACVAIGFTVAGMRGMLVRGGSAAPMSASDRTVYTMEAGDPADMPMAGGSSGGEANKEDAMPTEAPADMPADEPACEPAPEPNGIADEEFHNEQCNSDKSEAPAGGVQYHDLTSADAIRNSAEGAAPAKSLSAAKLPGLSELLAWADDHEGEPPARDCDYSISLSDDNGHLCTVEVWTEGERLICRSDLDMRPYLAAGTPDALEELLG